MPSTPLTVDPSNYGPILAITIQKGDVVLAAAAKAGRTVTRVYGYNSASTSDHRFKQCIDFMHYGNTPMRLWLEDYLTKNAKALGVMGIISNGQCMGFPSNETNHDDCEVYWNGPEGTWRKYSGYDQHTDHVHVQFNTAPVQVTVAPKHEKTGPQGQTLHTMYCTHDGTKGYAKPPAVGKVKHIRKKGFRVVGYPVRRSDGRYLRTLWGFDYPLSDLSPTKPKK